MKRGLKGVRLIISDAHVGLKQAISTVMTGTTWQRCRVHFMRNLLVTVPQVAREAIAAIVRTIFAQPDHASAMQQFRKVADGLRGRFPQAAALLEEAAEDVVQADQRPTPETRTLAAQFYRQAATRMVGKQAADAARYNIARADYLEGRRTTLSRTLEEFVRNG